MKRLLLPAFLMAALLGAPLASQAATGPKKPRTAKAHQRKAAAARSTTAASATLSPDDDAPWAMTAPVTDPVQPTDDPAMHSSGVMIAPGMNTAPYRGTSTDYNGRPIRRPAKKAVAAAPVDNSAADDPMMRSSGVMAAPGMNTAPYRGVSTDYHGRPLKKKASGASVLASAISEEAPVASAEVPEQ